MSLHDRIAELYHGYPGASFQFKDGYEVAKNEAAHIAKEADARIAELEQQLKRQANAAKMGMDAAKKSGAAMYEHGKKMLAESSPEAIESERAANAILTDRIEELETMVKVFRGCIETRQFPEQGSRCHKIVHELLGENEDGN